jgi:hypothetical protein
MAPEWLVTFKRLRTGQHHSAARPSFLRDLHISSPGSARPWPIGSKAAARRPKPEAQCYARVKCAYQLSSFTSPQA